MENNASGIHTYVHSPISIPFSTNEEEVGLGGNINESGMVITFSMQG